MRIGTWVAFLLVAGIPSSDARQSSPETEALIRASIDQRFALMPESWRGEFSRRLAGRIDDRRVAAPTRVAILKQVEQVIDEGSVSLVIIQHAAAIFPSAAPPEETVVEGCRYCAVAIDAVIRNAVLYVPLSEDEKAARRSDLKTFERETMRVLNDRVVGDDRARGIVSARIAGMFKAFEEEIGNPTRPFLNYALPAGTLREIVEDLEKSLPRENKYLVTGLTGDPESDEKKLQEQGVSDLIYDVVMNQVHRRVLRASWADQAALKEGMAASEKLQEWRETVRESIRVKAVEQKIESDKLRELLDPPSRVPRPITKTSENPSTGAVSLQKDLQAPGNGASTTTPAPSAGARWPVLAVGAALVAVLLIVLRKRPKPA